MMVTFISQCEKKALKKTRRVLDAFAERIGDNTWQTVITREGLNTVKKMLGQTASKSTAVSCHWIRSRSRSQLLWVVGNRNKFDARGVVPVNSTKKIITNFGNDWHHLPLIKALAALAALFHDWGKASALFQEKLKVNSRLGDPIRHEWISCLLLRFLINNSGAWEDDTVWLQKLTAGDLDEKTAKVDLQEYRNPLEELPSAANLICWLIVSHHRMPLPMDKEDWKGEPAPDIAAISKFITCKWGYENRRNDENDYQKRLNACFEFPYGLLSQSPRWMKQVKKWAQRLCDQLPVLQQCMDNGGYRLLLHHARLCLMLGDHYHSSQKAEPNWQDTTGLFANTDRRTKKFKQKLDEHLVGVTKHALHIAHLLPRFEHDPPVAQGGTVLKKPSSREYDWQNKAVKTIRQWREKEGKSRQGVFAVNMAGTGCGKTFANAKIMRALSTDGDSLRYTLALGLRTLTMQTGDEYRDRIKLDDSELAVLIGSSAIMELHSQKSYDDSAGDEGIGSESLEPLLTEEVDYDCDIPEEGLATVLERRRARPFLYSPVLVCTIDHMMAATESRRGGRYILPSLRMMSSDLVIDEVDDFSGADLVAIGRLIHLAGMMGRKVMISSATVPPDLAEGYFNAYREGWRIYCLGREAAAKIGCLWIDEFRSDAVSVDNIQSPAAVDLYREKHLRFVKKRVAKLTRQPARRKADIIDCQSIVDDYEFDGEESRQASYFAAIQQAIMDKHQHNYTEDRKTGIKVSFGVVRVANIAPCIAATRYLLESDWPDGVEERIMAYHSQQVLLLRHEQEKHLDNVLKRKENHGEPPKAFNDNIIRRHLDNSDAQHMIFILVATPVEEVGRDHDFDWAVVEPSSYRSIIQLAGRVRRHRQAGIDTANISLLQYNWRSVRDGNRPGKKYFRYPGYEEKKTLNTHDLRELIDIGEIAGNITAVPRIKKPEHPDYRNSLAALEHAVIHDLLTSYDSVGPEQLQGYLAGAWYLTALPQALNPFRKGEPTTKVFLRYDPGDRREVFFVEKDYGGQVVDRENILRIQHHEITNEQADRLWLRRDYKKMLRKYAKRFACSKENISLRYGELSFIHRDGQEYEYSDQFGLVEKE